MQPYNASCHPLLTLSACVRSHLLHMALVSGAFAHCAVPAPALSPLYGLQVTEYVDDGTPADKHLRKIAIHVSAYITHVRTQLKQTIPKAIVHTLVRHQGLIVSPARAACGSTKLSQAQIPV